MKTTGRVLSIMSTAALLLAAGCANVSQQELATISTASTPQGTSATSAAPQGEILDGRPLTEIMYYIVKAETGYVSLPEGEELTFCFFEGGPYNDAVRADLEGKAVAYEEVTLSTPDDYFVSYLNDDCDVMPLGRYEDTTAFRSFLARWGLGELSDHNSIRI